MGFESADGGKGKFEVVNRLAIDELEAWFFGDPEALVKAYPRVPSSIGNKAKIPKSGYHCRRNLGGLERVLKRAGYYSSGMSGMPKVETARTISKYMIPERNRSKSSQIFREALQELSS
ncbi:MAG: DUF4276 family protein [Deltaproteobacteria bacterium]|nr:DUF4276 family protein [Deltaproteobacteria bacterium]